MKMSIHGGTEHNATDTRNRNEGESTITSTTASHFGPAEDDTPSKLRVRMTSALAQDRHKHGC